MRDKQTNFVEFRFLGSGGSAAGPWGIAAFVVLALCAMVCIVIVVKTAPLIGSALFGFVRNRF